MMSSVPQLVHKVYMSDGQVETIVDPAGLEMFKNSVVSELTQLGTDVRSNTSTNNNQNNSIQILEIGIDRALNRIRDFENQITEMQSFILHLMTLHPEWKDSWVKTEAVMKRLEESSYSECEAKEAIV